MSQNAFLSVAVVASTLNLSRQRVHQFILEGKLPAMRIGHFWIVSSQDLEAFQLDRELESFGRSKSA
jgi:excisionase family DNA binding protein